MNDSCLHSYVHQEQTMHLIDAHDRCIREVTCYVIPILDQSEHIDTLLKLYWIRDDEWC